jgi:hypothetical protein
MRSTQSKENVYGQREKACDAYLSEQKIKFSALSFGFTLLFFLAQPLLLHFVATISQIRQLKVRFN